MRSARKLNFSDTFRLARIINSAGITAKEINEMLSASSKAKNEVAGIKDKAEREKKLSEYQENAGMEMIGYIIERAPQAETAINKFLASVANVKETEIANAPVTEIIELVGDIIKENKDIKDFFIQAFRSATVIPSTKS